MPSDVPAFSRFAVRENREREESTERYESENPALSNLSVLCAYSEVFISFSWAIAAFQLSAEMPIAGVRQHIHRPVRGDKTDPPLSVRDLSNGGHTGTGPIRDRGDDLFDV